MRRFALALTLAALAGPAWGALTLTVLGHPTRQTVAATWNTVTLPLGTDYVRLRPVGITGYWTTACTDGAALGSDYATITADTVEVLAVHQLDRSGAFCIAGSGAGTVEVTPMVRGK